LAEAVAARIAIALENARLYERERAIAGTLQQSLLPPHLPEVPGVELAHRYWTAGDTALVGGDFYDVIKVGADSWGVLVGDVSGKGISAAALTGVARQTARAAARHGVGPSDVLAWLDDAVKDQSDQFGGQYCTAVYGLLESRLVENTPEWHFRFVLGGHPRPVFIPAGREPTLVGRPGSVLGLLESPVFHEYDLVLAPGDTLLLYTDGVTDVAGPSALDDAGLLAVVGGAMRESPEATVTALYQALEARHARVARRDDTAILALHHPATASAHAHSAIELPALVSSPRRARHFVRETLEPLGVPRDTIDDSELVATELVTNSVMHARSEVTLSIEYANRSVRLRVEDGSPVRPVVRNAAPDAATGRGLFIVEQLASRWGIDTRRDGKAVWVELDL
jgi:serine phosphatase RsbU (regulator of sigma subunit)/anti-sigma regulatory factor (Ser/Thr protein kinase)